MTEEDWLACTDPEVMLLVAARDSERKQRLCATGLARLVLGHFLRGTTAAIQRLSAWLTSRRWLAQLDAAEEFADGSIDQKALIAARSESGGPYNFFLQVCRTTPSNLVFLANTLKALQEEFGVPSPAEVCYLFREVIDPFPPPPLPATVLAWNDSLIPKLALAIYAERAFERLPILGDALEEAGCTRQAILAHCRAPGPHVRGCRVVDLVLGKS